MESNKDKLIEKFKEIANKKYIEGVNRSDGAIGNTFEKELGKVNDSMFFPDYEGIEIKCTGRFSNYPVTLFGVTFDGPTFPEIYRLIEKYGLPDKDYPEKKVIFAHISYDSYEFLYNDNYIFKLDIDLSQEKIYLQVYDKYHNLIERESFVYLWSIYNHINTKLNYLALVFASKKKMFDKNYYRYYKMMIYRLKSYDNFLEQIKKGTFDIRIIARLTKFGNDTSRYRNKGLVFALKKELFDRVFNLEYVCDFDSNQEYYLNNIKD